MDATYWHKQTSDKPLFPELLWSRPEHKKQAGKLLIVGGNAHGFVAPAEAFRAAELAGIGTARMVLPDSLHKFVGPKFTAGELAPSTPSGSFSRLALATLLSEAAWADGVLLAGDLGKNSETAIMLEAYAGKYSGQLTIAGDSLDYFLHTPEPLLTRPESSLILGFAQTQQLAKAAKSPKAITSGMDLLRFIEILHELTEKFSANIIVGFAENICVAASGQVSTTKVNTKPVTTDLAAHAATWWLQNPTKPFEALSSAALAAIGASDSRAQS